jgi:hypothetical protein
MTKSRSQLKTRGARGPGSLKVACHERRSRFPLGPPATGMATGVVVLIAPSSLAGMPPACKHTDRKGKVRRPGVDPRSGGCFATFASACSPSIRSPLAVRTSHDAPPTLPSRAAPTGQRQPRERRRPCAPRGQSRSSGTAPGAPDRRDRRVAFEHSRGSERLGAIARLRVRPEGCVRSG